ncbi:hypothetical protein FOA52_010771 [Chlamydomonas sp. UWO 241]|nr:hypothetical protein FOA52_010771 [Chlamydomonas sp. UWO 241]
MEVTFRTVSGESFKITFEESTTVGGLKAAVQTERGHAADSLKLVYKGKVLDSDTATVGEAGISDAGFIVVFVSKPKAEPAPAAAAPAPAAAAPALAAAAGDAPAPAAAAAAAPAPAPAAAAAAAPAPAAGDGFLTGAELESAVSNICEMGFERSEVMRAMRAAFNNPERAVEYLMTGIPESAAPPAHMPAAAAAAGAGAGGAAPAAAPAADPALPFNMFGGAAVGAGGGGGNLSFLRSTPQFAMLRQAVRGNPGILTPMLQELGRANPQLIQLIQANQQEFLTMLQEEPTAAEMEALAALQAMGGGGGEGGQQQQQQQQVMVELSAEDMQKVERLQALGFERNSCIEALLACDSNEELAANFLAESMFD